MQATRTLPAARSQNVAARLRVQPTAREPDSPRSADPDRRFAEPPSHPAQAIRSGAFPSQRDPANSNRGLALWESTSPGPPLAPTLRVARRQQRLRLDTHHGRSRRSVQSDSDPARDAEPWSRL